MRGLAQIIEANRAIADFPRHTPLVDGPFVALRSAIAKVFVDYRLTLDETACMLKLIAEDYLREDYIREYDDED